MEAGFGVIRTRDATDPLVRWSHRVVERRGRLRAAVAVARRLSRVLWAIWKHGTWYDATGLLHREQAEAADGVERAVRAREDVAGAIEKRAIVEKKARLKIQRVARAHARALARTSSSPEVS